MLTEIKTDREHYFVDENNLIQGEYKDYYVNGQLWDHFFYLNDKPHGECKEYYNNGQLCEHSFYLNGKRHGEYHWYDQNGVLMRETFFFQGVDLKVDPSTLTEKDKAYILLSGRVPPKE